MASTSTSTSKSSWDGVHASLRDCHSKLVINLDPATALSSDGTSWAMETETEGVRIESCSTASSIRRFRAVTEIDAPAHAVARCLHWEERGKWDTNMASHRVVCDIGGDATIGHYVVNGAFGVSKRDFVDALCVRNEDDGAVWSFGLSVEHADAPVSSDAVRGFNFPGCGWCAQPIPSSSRCTFSYVISTDLKGWIPSMIVNRAMAGSMLALIQQMRHHLASSGGK